MATQAKAINFQIKDGTLSGPADYMQARGNAKVDKMLSGKDELFNACLSYSPNVETAICVWLQTDYAAYLGEIEMMGWTKRA